VKPILENPAGSSIPRGAPKREHFVLQKVLFCGGKTNIFILSAGDNFGAEKILQVAASSSGKLQSRPFKSVKYKDC